eukprot:scaffold8573_cov164-Amphora_coffeaeformis.AAC.4
MEALLAANFVGRIPKQVAHHVESTFFADADKIRVGTSLNGIGTASIGGQNGVHAYTRELASAGTAGLVAFVKTHKDSLLNHKFELLPYKIKHAVF